MQLDVWSDVICPWCWLGHTRLRAALAQLGIGDDVELRWRAFQLDPGAPTSAHPGADRPTDLRSSIEAKYGPGSFDAMTRRLTALGAEAGITYRFDIARRVNTFDAHRLLQAVQADGDPVVTDRLAERLFSAYFSEGTDVSDHATLAQLAAESSVPAGRAAGILASDEGAERVEADRAASREVGISGVPAVAWNDAVIIPGAQDVDTMARVLRRLHAKVG